MRPRIGYDDRGIKMNMKWEKSKPFYEQPAFWFGVGVVVVICRVLQRANNKIIVCGNANGNNGYDKNLPSA